eukprot:4040568-Ditylum_brightwellii.AAC.1
MSAVNKVDGPINVAKYNSGNSEVESNSTTIIYNDSGDQALVLMQINQHSDILVEEAPIRWYSDGAFKIRKRTRNY